MFVLDFQSRMKLSFPLGGDEILEMELYRTPDNVIEILFHSVEGYPKVRVVSAFADDSSRCMPTTDVCIDSSLSEVVLGAVDGLTSKNALACAVYCDTVNKARNVLRDTLSDCDVRSVLRAAASLDSDDEACAWMSGRYFGCDEAVVRWTADELGDVSADAVMDAAILAGNDTIERLRSGMMDEILADVCPLEED